ncbi:hypothetical protein [Lacticaseibacillus salsurivasis]|uniref:hypothetical protein n=1 Tax=Lacticaseibacillus salsurivasis TaxID=3081441 RepID=UPI0030C6A17C
MEELTKRKLAELDEMLEEYQDVDRLLARREFEIRYPWRPTDTNVGGGRSEMRTDAPDKTIEAIQTDARMIYLTRLKDACAATVVCLTDDQREVYETRYQSATRVFWPDVPDILHKSRSGVYKVRYSILQCLAKNLGWLS